MLRKLGDFVPESMCGDPQHTPPAHFSVDEPGIYEYTCPRCGAQFILRVPTAGSRGEIAGQLDESAADRLEDAQDFVMKRLDAAVEERGQTCLIDEWSPQALAMDLQEFIPDLRNIPTKSLEMIIAHWQSTRRYLLPETAT